LGAVERARIGGRRAGRMGIAFAPSTRGGFNLIADAKEADCTGPTMAEKTGSTFQPTSGSGDAAGIFCEVSVDPKDADTVYVPQHGLYRSARRREDIHGA